MQPYNQYLPSLLSLAKQAGDAIMTVYNRAAVGEAQVRLKADDSPLTQADLASHHIIVDALAKLTPDIPILSEEASDIPYETRSQWKTYWLIDPLDGTKEFISRNGEFTVNIALIDNKEPVIGVVYVPVKDELYYASKGDGAFYTTSTEKGDCISVATLQPSPSRMERGDRAAVGEVRIVVSRSHAGPETQAYLQRLEERGLTLDTLSIGSSLKLCYVANGRAHVYPRFGPTMEWDIAAAQCIVEEAGGFVRDPQQQRLTYNKPDMHSPHFIAACCDWL